MPNRDIVCPVCLTPATKCFEFGGTVDPHGYYRCNTCGRSRAVQHRRDGQPGRCSPWVRLATPTTNVKDHMDEADPMTSSGERGGGAETVTVRPKPDRRTQPRIPPPYLTIGDKSNSSFGNRSVLKSVSEARGKSGPCMVNEASDSASSGSISMPALAK